MTGRVRTQKKIYTPTTSTPEPNYYLCRIIDSGECLIIQRSSLKRIYNDTAEIMLHGQRTEASILHRGTREECRRVWEKSDIKINNFDEQISSSSEDNEDEDEDVPMEILTSFSKSKASTNSKVPQRTTTASSIDFHTQTNSHSTSRHPAKRIKRNNFEQAREVDRNSNDIERETTSEASTSASSIINHIDVLVNTMRKESENQFAQLSRKIDRKHSFENVDLCGFRDVNDTELHNDIDEKLLQMRGKNVGDYSCQLLRAIFTHDELLSSILPPGGEHYSRKPLDTQKFEIFHKTIRAKYRIVNHRYDDFYNKLIRPKLVDFLSDERKRDRKTKQKRQSTDASLFSTYPDGHDQQRNTIV